MASVVRCAQSMMIKVHFGWLIILKEWTREEEEGESNKQVYMFLKLFIFLLHDTLRIDPPDTGKRAEESRDKERTKEEDHVKRCPFKENQKSIENLYVSPVCYLRRRGRGEYYTYT